MCWSVPLLLNKKDFFFVSSCLRSMFTLDRGMVLPRRCFPHNRKRREMGEEICILGVVKVCIFIRLTPTEPADCHSPSIPSGESR